MAQKTYAWRLGRTVLDIRVADELWTTTLANGERSHHLIQCGWSDRADSPDIKVWSLTLLWLSVHLGVISK